MMAMFPANGTVPFDGTECLGFEVDAEGRVHEIGKPPPFTDPVPALHPEQSLREQALIEQEGRIAASAKHAADTIERDRQREAMNDRRHNEELARRQEAITR